MSTARTDPPTRDFWESELELPYDHALEAIQRDGFWDDWIDARNGRQLDRIAAGLGLDAVPARKRKERLRPYHDRLESYALAQEFIKFKSSLAILEQARQHLPAEVVEACCVRDEEHDSVALGFALLDRDHRLLPRILHLDKYHKSGFARMRLVQNPRSPRRPFGDFLRGYPLAGIVSEVLAGGNGRRVAELRDSFSYDGRELVFVRRSERPDRLLRDRRLVHGYRPEWNVLDFSDTAKRANIASDGTPEAVALANRIATDYFGVACAYENNLVSVSGNQVTEFLRHLRSEPADGLVLVEVSVSNSPLTGAPSVRISDPEARPIGPAIEHFDSGIGRLLGNPERIQAVKVRFGNKRVAISFAVDAADRESFVVRYQDHHLTGPQRRAFENLLRATYGITVLSHEARHSA